MVAKERFMPLEDDMGGRGRGSRVAISPTWRVGMVFMMAGVVVSLSFN